MGFTLVKRGLLFVCYKAFGDASVWMEFAILAFLFVLIEKLFYDIQ